MSNDLAPLVSIVIPVYNGSNYLREAIDSALAQTYKNIEILVINDGSNDDGRTEAIARSYGNKIRYFCKTNGGVSSALNLGIKEMRGEYFSWLSHDDVYYPEKTERQVKHLKNIQDREKVVLYSDYDFIDERSAYIRTKKIKAVPAKQFQFELIAGSPLNGCSVLIPKACIKATGFFKEELRSTQDIDYWFRLAEQFDLIHTPDVLVKTRIHGQQGQVVMGSHNNEANKLWIRLMNSKTPAQWLEISNESSAAIAFARLALGLQWKGFSEAAKRAFGISITNISKTGIMDTIKCSFILTIYLLLRGGLLKTLRMISKKALVLVDRK